MRRALALAAAAALVPATEAFAFGAAPAVRAPGCTGQQMCANGDGAPKASLSSKAVALFSALCIGGVAPSASRARDLSADAQATIVGDGTALVVTEEAPKESRSMKSVLVGGVAGAAGFGSVFLLRKGAKKDPSPQEFMEKKQEEWKAEAPNVSRAAQVPCMRHTLRARQSARRCPQRGAMHVTRRSRSARNAHDSGAGTGASGGLQSKQTARGEP